MSLKEVPSLLAAVELTPADVMRCTLGLRTAELEAYFVLAKHESVTTQEMSGLIGRSRPTAQRLLQDLVSKGLATRQESLIGRGGYTYRYQAVPPETVKGLVREMLEKWYSRVLTYLDQLPEGLLTEGHPPTETSKKPGVT
ncbi:MAG: helix-turn-helix domain-containing protein [Candidatus Bathyarchaeia archaeon]